MFEPLVDKINMQYFLVKKLFDGKNFLNNQCVEVENGFIKAISTFSNINEFSAVKTSEIQVIHELLVPGFIDIQVNGGGGVLFNQQPTAHGLKVLFNAHAKFGSTAILPTVITDAIEIMQKAADAIAEMVTDPYSGIVGIHFEGPHLSIAKKGAHSDRYIRAISDAEWQIFSRKDLGKIVVTLAPETFEADDIQKLVNMGVKVSLGHSNANFECSQAALAAGANCFTHLYNAMSAMQSRAPGMVGAALLADDAYCGLIVDGHHVDFAVCELAIKTKPKGKVCLVTDAMSLVGTNENSFGFFDREVTLENGKLTSTTGELAGSMLTMNTAVKNTVQHVNIERAEAFRMASEYPATFIGDPILGAIKIGCKANFVELTDEFSVCSTWVLGKKVF